MVNEFCLRFENKQNLIAYRMGLFCLNDCENYDKICGQILFTTKGRLAFYCTLCGKYWDYKTFINHLLENCSQLLDDDLKQCISFKSLTGSSLNIQVHKTKPVVKQPETQCERKVYIENIEDLSELPRTNPINSSDPQSPANTIDRDVPDEMIIDESIDQELIEVERYDGNEYENFEYLEDEPIEKEIQNSKLLNRIKADELTNSLQYSSPDSKQNEKAKHNNSEKVFIDAVTVPLVVRNVQVRKNYFPSHIAPEERKFICPVCGAAFKDRANRSYHLNRHTNNKKHSCPDCGKKFFTSTEVRIHSRVHSKPENLFLCTECGRSFDTNCKLLNHQKRHTNQRDYVCKECNKGFYQLEGLKAHMAVHSSARPYSCEICGSAFKRRHILKAHMKQHENKREFKCKLCEAAFNVQAGVYSHMKSKHKDYIQVD